ncbi:MAG: fused MFS/spermidine synthase [Acidobacteria bacterium]|nr:fused MFS/spermidine synthase [Acidobacteriota bacterium]
MLKRFQSIILEITVFVCGALVMIFEIIGSRILSPFIGASTYIWTSLIGVILASLSLGYWLGGRLADNRPDVKILASVIFAAGGLISLTVLIKDVLLSTIASAAMMIEIKALIAAVVLFAPASICLGFVTPFAVRLKMTTLEETGRTVGRLYALSTIGSIIGTFAAGFFLIPFLGSVRTLYLIAAALIALSALLVPFSISKTNIAAITFFILGVVASEGGAYILRTSSGVYDIDTEYSRVQVFETKDPASGRPIRALATDPYFVQSAIFLDSDELVLEYGKYYHLISPFKPDFTSTLLIGGAGYTFPREYLKTYPNARIDVVEIDPQMTRIARDHFRMKDDPRMQIFHEDGRMFINRAETAKYDTILMDAFGSLFSVPHHLTTLEAVTQFSRILSDDGVIVFNLGAAISGEGSTFLAAELATYKQVFPQVHLFKVNSDYPDEKLQNLIMVASKSTDPALIQDTDSTAMRLLLDHRYTGTLPQGAAILTDDLAPVEYYNSIAQNLYLSSR